MGEPSEFGVIDALFKPLAGFTPEARGLMDDTAVIPAQPDDDIVVTTDAMVEGVHFLSSDPLDTVAQKLLRVNLSDLAAKGAVPYGYQLMTAWPKGMSFEDKALFAKGLKTAQELFGIDLFGGDTVSTSGPLVVCVTAFGKVPRGRALSRAAAKPGDRVLVSGPVGQGFLGLRVLLSELGDIPEAAKTELIDAYQLPLPRLDVAEAIRRHAHAAMDISDGLIIDAGHIAEASHVDIHIDLETVPVSDAAQYAVASGISLVQLVTGGDDYQVLCTVPAERVGVLLEAGFSDIGQCLVAAGDVGVVTLLDGGRPMSLEVKGWQHI